MGGRGRVSHATYLYIQCIASGNGNNGARVLSPLLDLLIFRVWLLGVGKGSFVAW